MQRGIDNVLAGVDRYPSLRDIVRIEVVTEDPSDVAALTARYADAAIPVATYLLPAGHRTPRGTRLKARALEYMVEQHRLDPDDCYVVHYDEESVFTPDNLARLVQRLLRHPVGISEGMISYGVSPVFLLGQIDRLRGGLGVLEGVMSSTTGSGSGGVDHFDQEGNAGRANRGARLRLP